MFEQRLLDVCGIDALSPVGCDAMHHKTVRLCKTGPHFTKLSVATRDDFVAWRKEVANGGLGGTAPRCMHGKHVALGSEYWAEHFDHLAQLFPEFRTAMVHHRSRTRTQYAFG